MNNKYNIGDEVYYVNRGFSNEVFFEKGKISRIGVADGGYFYSVDPNTNGGWFANGLNENDISPDNSVWEKEIVKRKEQNLI